MNNTDRDQLIHLVKHMREQTFQLSDALIKKDDDRARRALATLKSGMPKLEEKLRVKKP